MIKILEGRYAKLKDVYSNLVLNKRDKFKVDTRSVPRHLRVNSIEYVYITFRNCNSAEIVEEVFKKDVSFVKCVKNCCKLCTAKKKQKKKDAQQIQLETKKVLITGSGN